jgi:hypothetical protein
VYGFICFNTVYINQLSNDFKSPEVKDPKAKPEVKEADSSILQLRPVEQRLTNNKLHLLIKTSAAIPVRRVGCGRLLPLQQLRAVPFQQQLLPVHLLHEHDADGPPAR